MSYAHEGHFPGCWRSHEKRVGFGDDDHIGVHSIDCCFLCTDNSIANKCAVSTAGSDQRLRDQRPARTSDLRWCCLVGVRGKPATATATAVGDRNDHAKVLCPDHHLRTTGNEWWQE